ncbi:MAG: head GIN domain-containing protein [Chloroflexota bacterium]|nr:head GIN domain-containing protein [Chloroflexota bacterium]
MSRIWVVVLILGLLTSGCAISLRYEEGSGVLNTEQRDVSDFDRVSFEGFGTLIIAHGSEESLTIEAEDNIVPRIETNVRGGTLEIGFDTDRWQDIVRPTKSITYTLTVITLDGITLSGAGSIEASGIDAERFDVELSGAGSIEISGFAVAQEINVSGAGSYDGAEFQSESIDVSISGAGSATVWATDSLDVNISGVGNVSYYGDPQVRESVSGLGNLKALGSP